MAISLTRYVDITSGIGAGAVVPRRNLIGRLFTTNQLVPTKTSINFTTLADVGTYFGTTSDEYKRASFYFSWISKNVTRAQSIDFARWVDANSAPRIYGQIKAQAVSTYTSITSGSFGLTIGGVSHTFTGLNFSTVLSLSDVADVIQTAINSESGTQWTGANVSWNSTRGSFDFVGGDAVQADISVQEGVGGTPIANIIGWLTGSTLILSNGELAETITDVLTQSANANDNFGSFLFMPTLTTDQINEAATWNNAQNEKFIYCIPVTASNYQAIFDSVGLIGGSCGNLSPLSTEYVEELPMAIFAATDYTKINSVQNYMYQIANLTPSVTTDADADTYDAVKINYYGQTQSAGQNVSFYQRGVMFGSSTDAATIGVYANEIWLKDAMSSSCLTLFLSVSQLPANQKGRAQLTSVLQSVINEALNNGTISVGKTLTTTQQLYITEVTGDDNAWYQVQNIGYWLNCAIVSYTDSSNIVQYKAVYTLVYSKDDTINKIEGTHILI